MNWQQVSEMPVVENVLRRAEAEIQDLTGVGVVIEIKDYFQMPTRNSEDAKKMIQKTICDYYNVTWLQIQSSTRSKKERVLDARHAYFYIAFKRAGIPCPEVAKDCNMKDHTSVLSACKKIEGFYDVGDRAATEIDNIIKQLPKQILKNEKV